MTKEKNTTKPTIHYVSASMGSGKTYSAEKWAIYMSGLGEKIIFAQPSIKLLEQTENNLNQKDSAIDVIRIDSDTSNNVISDILTCIEQAGENGKILLITQTAYNLLPFKQEINKWNLIWDEIEDPIKNLTQSINKSADTMFPIFDWLDFNLSKDLKGYYEVAPNLNHLDKLKSIAINEYDDIIFNQIREFTSLTLSADHTVYASIESIEKIRARDFNNDSSKLFAYSMMSIEKYFRCKSTVILGAFFEDSPFYKLYKEKCAFKVHSQIKNALREAQRQTTIELYYLIDDKEFPSKTLYKTSDNQKTFMDYYGEEIKSFYKGEEFCYSMNEIKAKDGYSDPFKTHHGATKLPYSAHGLNNYQHIHNYAHCAAYQDTSQFFDFCQSLGVKDEVLHARMTIHALQSMWRTSKRDPKNTIPNRDLFETKFMCEAIQSYFPDITIKKLPISDDTQTAINNIRGTSLNTRGKGRSNFWPTDKIKHAAKYQKNKNNKQNLHDIPPNILEAKGGNKVTMTCFSTQYREFSQNYDIDDTDYFIRELQLCYTASIKAKDNNTLMSPAKFDPELSESTNFGEKNVTSAWGIFFDIDGGDLKPDDWERFIPDTRHVCFSTYSNGKNGETRYRVFIPTTRIMTAEEYKAVTSRIAEEVNNSLANSGIDGSKFTASSLFYMPCQAEIENNSFFIDNAGKELDPAPYVLQAQRIREAKSSSLYSVTDKKSNITMDPCIEILANSITSGNRNNIVCKIAGMLKNASNDEKYHWQDVCVDKSIGDSSKKATKKIFQQYCFG